MHEEKERSLFINVLLEMELLVFSVLGYCLLVRIGQEKQA